MRTFVVKGNLCFSRSMDELLDKLPAVRNISNRIVVLERKA